MSGVDAVGPESSDLFDFGQLRLWAGFVRRSMRRHRRRAIVVFCVIAGLAAFSALSADRQFLSGATLIVRNDSVINAITVPGQTISSSQDAPQALLVDPTIRSTANLERLVDELQLVAHRYDGERKLGKVKRSLLGAVLGKADGSKARRAMVDKLRAAFTVTTDPSESVKQTVHVSLKWNEPVAAQAILTKALANLLADRRVADIGPREDAVAIARKASEDADKKVAQLRFDLNIPTTDERILPESSPLKSAMTIQGNLAQRYEDARIQLANAESAFKYRYETVTPASLPTAPVSGSSKLLLLGIVGGLVMAAFATAAKDIQSGKVVEAWQVTRGLGLPQLAELPS